MKKVALRGNFLRNQSQNLHAGPLGQSWTIPNEQRSMSPANRRMPSISNSKSRSLGRKMAKLSPTGSRLSIKNLLAVESRRSATSKSLSRKSMSKKSLERSLSNLRKNKKKGVRK